MVKGKPTKRNNDKEKDKSQALQNTDFNFRFDDVKLQERYITAWNNYEKVLPNFPLPKSIGQIDAKSLTQGSNARDLNIIHYVISRDNDDKGDSAYDLHKGRMMQEIAKEVKGANINWYIKNYFKAFAEIEKTTGAPIFNANKTRYNYVFYARGYGDN